MSAEAANTAAAPVNAHSTWREFTHNLHLVPRSAW